MNKDAAAKMARIQLSKRRHERNVSTSSHASYQSSLNAMQPSRYDAPLPPVPPPANFAVELPAEDVVAMQPRPLQFHHQTSVADMKYTVIPDDQPQSPTSTHSQSFSNHYQPRPSVESPRASTASLRSRHSIDQYSGQARPGSEPLASPTQGTTNIPPPLPPKMPLPYPTDSTEDVTRRWQMAPLRKSLPYPDDDGPPPPVNISRKPEWISR